MRRILKWFYWIAGAACIGYYFLIGHASRFGLDMSWIWPVGGAVLMLAGLTCLTGRIPRWIRYAWRGALCAGIALVLALECCVVSGMTRTPPACLDYLIILGARVESDSRPSPALQRRLNAALDYLEENPETVVVVSGGKGSDEPISEAQCMFNSLTAAGIAPERIILEDQSRKTSENFEFSRALMESPERVSVGYVTNNYHVFRAGKLAQKAGFPEIHGYAAEYTGHTLFHYMIREAACTIADGILGNF